MASSGAFAAEPKPSSITPKETGHEFSTFINPGCALRTAVDYNLVHRCGPESGVSGVLCVGGGHCIRGNGTLCFGETVENTRRLSSDEILRIIQSTCQDGYEMQPSSLPLLDKLILKAVFDFIQKEVPESVRINP